MTEFNEQHKESFSLEVEEYQKINHTIKLSLSNLKVSKNTRFIFNMFCVNLFKR